MSQAPVTAAILIIGDEILSGRTQDKNINHIARWLTERGIDLSEVRVIPDEEATVIDAVNNLRSRYTYLLTTGGLGPTHDDITADCIAKAVGQPLELHPEAFARLENHYGKADFTPARQRMARIPKTGRLIDNPVSIAPGFEIENIFVMAGVPKIMQAMLENLNDRIKGGAVVHSRALTIYLAESKLADPLSDLNEAFADISVGSYPFFGFETGRGGSQVVIRSRDKDILDQAWTRLYDWVKSEGLDHDI